MEIGKNHCCNGKIHALQQRSIPTSTGFVVHILMKPMACRNRSVFWASIKTIRSLFIWERERGGIIWHDCLSTSSQPWMDFSEAEEHYELCVWCHTTPYFGGFGNNDNNKRYIMGVLLNRRSLEKGEDFHLFQLSWGSYFGGRRGKQDQACSLTM